MSIGSLLGLPGNKPPTPPGQDKKDTTPAQIVPPPPSPPAAMPEDVVTVGAAPAEPAVPPAATTSPEPVVPPAASGPDEPPAALPPAAPPAPPPVASPASGPAPAETGSVAPVAAAAPSAPSAGSYGAYREAAKLFHGPVENPRLATAGSASADGQAAGTRAPAAPPSTSAIKDVVSLSGQAGSGSVAKPDDAGNVEPAGFDVSTLQLKLYDPRQWVTQWSPGKVVANLPAAEQGDDPNQLSFALAQPFSDQPRAGEEPPEGGPVKREYSLPWPDDNQAVA